LNVVRLMSENLAMQDSVSNQENSTSSLPTTAGQLLKQARQDAGLHIAALAVSLRVPVKRIEALENGQMDLLPDVVFVRALTSSICQVLKVDPQPILNKLPKVAVPRLNRDDIAINTPIGDGKTGKTVRGQDSASAGIFASPLLFGVLFLCVGSITVYFWPAAKTPTMPEAVFSAKAQSEMGAETGVNQAREVQVASENASASNLNASAVGTANTSINMNANASANTLTNDIAASAPLAASATEPGKTVVQTMIAGADNLVTFKATGETWVEVKGAKGNILFKKLLAAGETAGTSGPLPLTVIVGRADVTQVEVRGKPMDLAAIAKSNVARFEVK
jgi:cytoskeleton protein RodZ